VQPLIAQADILRQSMSPANGGSPPSSAANPNQVFDLRPAAGGDPLLIVQKEVPKIYLKWYIPTFLVVAALIALWRPPLSFTPGLLIFVAVAGGAAATTAVAARAYISGPKPRRLPIRLEVGSTGLQFRYADGEGFALDWRQRGLWLELARPAPGPRTWDPKAGDRVLDASGGPEAMRARQARMFGGEVPSSTLRCGKREAVLTPEAFEAVIEGAKRAACRVKTVRGDSWDSWLIQEPVKGPRVWAD
jgi:hypothetical protein